MKRINPIRTKDGIVYVEMREVLEALSDEDYHLSSIYHNRWISYLYEVVEDCADFIPLKYNLDFHIYQNFETPRVEISGIEIKLDDVMRILSQIERKECKILQDYLLSLPHIPE